MRLSDRIMEGSFFMQHVSNPTGEKGFGCALQLATGKVGGYGEELRPIYPWLINSSVSCPECGDPFLCIEGIIGIHLNDRHKWSLSKIVDWVRSIEPPEPDFVAERGVDSLPHKSETAPREVSA
jgi:hypothetical protein